MFRSHTLSSPQSCEGLPQALTDGRLNVARLFSGAVHRQTSLNQLAEVRWVSHLYSFHPHHYSSLGIAQAMRATLTKAELPELVARDLNSIDVKGWVERGRSGGPATILCSLYLSDRIEAQLQTLNCPSGLSAVRHCM